MANEVVDVRPRSVSRHGHRAKVQHGQRLWGPMLASLLLMAVIAALLAWWFGVSFVSRSDEVIRSEFQRQGLGAIAVSVEGRRVHLAGELPTGVPPGLPVALAQAASCNWWGLQRPCAASVTANLRPARVALDPAATPTVPAAPAMPAVRTVTPPGTAP